MKNSFKKVDFGDKKNHKKDGPWVAHMKMTVYKGIGQHISSQSQAMNCDRSAVSKT